MGRAEDERIGNSEDYKLERLNVQSPSLASVGYTPDQVLKAVYESGLHQYTSKVLATLWKDGIDIDVHSIYLMNFVRKLQGL